MNTELKFGKIITGPAERDAVHIAVAPLIAGEDLLPGQHVGVKLHLGHLRAVTTGEHLGIVDPFLKVRVKKGEEIWVFLYPGSITSLRHYWEHPAFKPRSEADVWEGFYDELKPAPHRSFDALPVPPGGLPGE